MKSSTLIVALASSASSSIIVGRSVSAILSDISTINTNVIALESSIAAFTGDNIGAAGPITQVEATLDASIKQGTTDAKGTSPSSVSDSDATNVLNAVASLTPNVISAVNAFVAKLPAFNSIGIGGVAQNLLSQLQTDTDAFASALVSIAPSAEQASASAAVSCINAAFASAKVSSSATSCGGAAVATSSGAAGSSSAATSGTVATSATGSSSGSPTSATGSSSGSPTSSRTTSSSPAATTTGSGSGSTGAGSSYSVGGSLGAGLAAIVALVL